MYEEMRELEEVVCRCLQFWVFESNWNFSWKRMSASYSVSPWHHKYMANAAPSEISPGHTHGFAGIFCVANPKGKKRRRAEEPLQRP
jgi:hypothetical protein